MPVITRSCSKQKNRPRIEDETPATTNANRRRYATRSSAKRKILQQENEEKDLEPPSKIATRYRSSKRLPKTSNNFSCKEINNTTINQDNKGGHAKGQVKSSRACTSRIPKRSIKHNKTTSRSNKECMNKENDNESQVVEESTCYKNASPNGNETIPKTPAGCVAARIRSYSALRRSQWKKNNKGQHSVNDNENVSSPVRSPLEEVSFNPRAMKESHESDEDILWKMSRHQMSEDMLNSSSDDEISYRNKYLMLVTAMKQLQNTFLRAQQNAERNVKASDKLVNELKSSLSMEKQKNSLLSEELKIKKGAVERLRSDLENTKKQLEYVTEEKVNLEKHDQEKSEKERNMQNKTIGNNEAEQLQLIEIQKSVIDFYSRLTGVSLSCDNTCQDASTFQSFNCTFFPDVNTTHCLQFRLTHDKEFDEFEYSPNPKSPGSEDVLLSLPKYLQDNIFFGADQAPRFLAKLLKTTE